MRHTKLEGLMTPIERMARVAASAYDAATAPATAPSGTIAVSNSDGTKTIIGPQAGSGDGAPSGQAMATHVGDTTPPPVPTGITAWSGDGSLHVMWDGTLSGGIPADFDHISILVDGEEVAQLSSAGSVTVGGVEAGATVSVTATAEDDACLADGTPAHNVSSPCTAIVVEIRDVAEEVKARADAHAGQIEAIQADIEAYKQSATATYATKTEVDEKTGAITKTLTADYTKTADLASTQAVKDAKKAGTDAQGSLSAYKASNDKAVADAKKAGTDAQSQLAGYKTSVEETYAEKTELTEAVNQLKSTMTSNYSAFTTYRTSNDTALSKAQSDATNAQSTIDSYKTANDKAVADAKSAGTTAQSQLSSYKSSNDAAVAAAKKAGTDAQSDLDAYRGTTDQRLDELKNVADNAIESWYLKGAPTTSNAPAKDWTTDALRRQHAGDLYMDTDTGYSYRWSGTAWVQVKDSDVTKALKEIQTVKTTYTTKSELTATDKELSGKISDTLTTARSYTDSSLEQEVTARNAAIKAQADSISLDVSRTYTKSETFSAYQTDADGRIATANANASTAVSTAKTAASDAATAKTNASSAVSTANAAKSTAQTASTNASNAVSTANSANSKSNSAVSTANSAKSAASTATSTANTAKSTADTAKSTADAVNRAAVKTYPYPNSLGVSKWVHLGDWSNTQDSHTLKIDLLSGSGYNAGTSQNSTVEIFVKDGSQSTASATNAYGATVTLGQLDRSKCHVDVIATSATSCSIWVNIAYVYDAGSYTVAMTPGDTWTHSGAVSSTEPTGTKQNVAFLTNAEEANAAAGAAQTLANNAQTTANTAVSSAAKALKEIESVKTTYATKSELKATDTELSGKVSDALTTAKSYTDGSVQREAIARDAAIKAQADSISLSVSKTYTKSETFSAYQTDADGRIATANSNASTAKSTAQTAAADAATAKTNASTAVSTANSASTSAANAVKTANAAGDSAASAVETANSASSTANDASTTASKASTDAAAAVKTANTASSNASTAVNTANKAVTTANAASSTASEAKTTAEDAASTASSAKSVADSASSTAKSASTSASNAVSTANRANSKSDSAVSTANAANSTAGTAKSTADAAQAKADDAWARTLRVEVMSAPADAEGDTSMLTAYAFRGGELLSDEAVARMGLLAWYVGGKRVATGYTYTCAAGIAAECRFEA